MTFTGCLEDTRTTEEKQKDWYKDIVAGSLDWKEKDFNDIKVFKVRDQKQSLSCVAQTMATMAGIENYLEEGLFIDFSASFPYRKRSNQGGGMIGVEALDVWRKLGITLEEIMPSQNLSEAEINSIPYTKSANETAKVFRIKDFYQLNFDIDAIAQIMESGRKNGVAKPLMTWFMFPRKEWNSKPKKSTSTSDIVHHSVTSIDYGMMNGKKGIFVQDSWGLHSTTVNGLRFISEDYLSRMTFCAYVNDLFNDHQTNKEVKITRTLKKGMKGEDVKELQKLLKINADGIFGRQTEKAVKSFQLENGLVSDGIVGQKTIAKLLS